LLFNNIFTQLKLPSTDEFVLH